MGMERAERNARILEARERGESFAAIGARFQIHRTTARDIVYNQYEKRELANKRMLPGRAWVYWGSINEDCYYHSDHSDAIRVYINEDGRLAAFSFDGNVVKVDAYDLYRCTVDHEPALEHWQFQLKPEYAALYNAAFLYRRLYRSSTA